MRRKKTEASIVLAEKLRRQLELMFGRSTEDKNFEDADGGREATLVGRYAKYIDNIRNVEG
jgi:hypothetical protein